MTNTSLRSHGVLSSAQMQLGASATRPTCRTVLSLFTQSLNSEGDVTQERQLRELRELQLLRATRHQQPVAYSRRSGIHRNPFSWGWGPRLPVRPQAQSVVRRGGSAHCADTRCARQIKSVLHASEAPGSPETRAVPVNVQHVRRSAPRQSWTLYSEYSPVTRVTADDSIVCLLTLADVAAVRWRHPW